MVSAKHDHDTKARVRQEQHTKVDDKKAENSGKMRMDRHPGALCDWRVPQYRSEHASAGVWIDCTRCMSKPR